MNRQLAISAMFLALANPAFWLGKTQTTKIIIQGADLATPIQIADRKIVADFQVVSGKGTYSHEPRLEEPSFIIDWSQGPAFEPSKALPRYEILFYADRSNERLVYAVSYAFDSATGKGYVHLPGQSEDNYDLNVHTIIRRVEGRWFYSWDKWDGVAQKLIQARGRKDSSDIGSAAHNLRLPHLIEQGCFATGQSG